MDAEKKKPVAGGLTNSTLTQNQNCEREAFEYFISLKGAHHLMCVRAMRVIMWTVHTGGSTPSAH